MKKFMKRFLSLFLAVLFAFCIVGCKDKKAEDDGSDYEYEYEYVEVPNGKDKNETNTTGNNNDDGNQSNVNDKSNPTNNEQTNNDSKVTVDLEKIKGTKLNVLMWRDLAINEKEKIDNFQKKYGVTVKITYTTQNMYASKLSSMVTNKQSPDVAVFPSAMFPLGVQSLFQSIDVTGQNLNDSVWNKKAMDNYKIGGKNYCFLSYNNWYTCSAIILYNKDLFNKLGIPTPLEKFKQGNWNWDTMEELSKQVVAKGKADGNNYWGLYAQTDYGVDDFIGSTGNDFIKKTSNGYESAILDSKTTSAFTKMTQMLDNGSLEKMGSPGNFFTGKMAMMVTNIWATLLNGGLGQLNFNAEYVPFPCAKGQEEVMVEAFNKFGVPKGAKNPVAAGLFIKEFLDPKNTPAYAGYTNCPNSEEMFKYVTSKDRTYSTAYGAAVLGYSNSKALEQLRSDLWATSPSQVTTVLNKNNALVSNAVNTVNKKVK